MDFSPKSRLFETTVSFIGERITGVIGYLQNNVGYPTIIKLIKKK